MSIIINRSLQRYIFLLCLIRSTLCLTCPDLVDSTTSCHSSHPCKGEGNACYRDPAAASTVRTGICCNSTFCLDTKLESYAEKDNNDRYTFNASDLTMWTLRTNESVNYTCPIPFSALFVNLDDATEEEKYPYNNNSQWREDGNVHVETCGSNAACAYLNNADYGGYCFENKKSSPFSKSAKFCFKLKNLANSEYLLDPAKDGPKFCTNNIECAGGHLQGLKYDAWYCHTTDRYLEGNGKANGICLRTRACLDNEYATRPSVGNVCADNKSCNGTGPATSGLNPREQYEPICSQLQMGSNPDLCCQKRLPSCEMGDTVIPRVACQTTADCNKDVMQNDFLFHNKWCGAEKTCCESKTDHNIVYCPDEATPLRFEKKCEGYKIGQNDSGSCPNSVLNPDVVTSGICKLGHCCPGLVKSLGSNLPTYSFATNLLCDSSDKPPTRYIHAYCDKKTKHIVIAGVHGFDGKKVTKTSTTCKQNSDCDGNNVCVFSGGSTNNCYGITLAEVESNLKNIIIGIVSAIGGVLAIVITCLLWKWKCKKKPPPSQEVDALMKEYTEEEKVQRANIKDCLNRWYASLTMESLDKMVSSVSDIPTEEPLVSVPVEPATQVQSVMYNANVVTMPNGTKFIATELPVSPEGENPLIKMDRFWFMVFQTRAPNILMFGDTWRQGGKKIKRADPFIPDVTFEFGKCTVYCSKADASTGGIFEREMAVSIDKLSNTDVDLAQYSEWDEYFAPTTTDSTLKLYEKFRNQYKTVVVCHYGVGPTGVFLALIYIFQKIAKKTNATIVQLIDEIRKMRRGAVRTQYQFLFLLQCIYEKAEKDGIIEHMPGMDLVKEKMKKMRGNK